MDLNFSINFFNEKSRHTAYNSVDCLLGFSSIHRKGGWNLLVNVISVGKAKALNFTNSISLMLSDDVVLEIELGALEFFAGIASS